MRDADNCMLGAVSCSFSPRHPVFNSARNITAMRVSVLECVVLCMSVIAKNIFANYGKDLAAAVLTLLRPAAKHDRAFCKKV